MKRIFAFFCALVLFLTGFPITAGFGAEMDIVAEETAQDLVVVEPKEKELFPDLPPNTALFSTRNTALEHTLPDGFMEYLLEHFGNGETSFSIEQFNIPHSRWDELTSVIWHETPELFHVKTLGCTYYQSTDVIVDVTVTYLPYADTAAEYDTCLDKILSGAEYLLQGIKGNNALTDVEKALILHDRLAVWTEYDVEGANTTNTYNKIHTAYSALGEGSAVCQGYAMAYMYLLEQAGIESDYCYSDALNHGWNVVYIDGIAYHVDVTWDDPTTSNATYNDIYGRVYHRNFLLSSEGIWNTGHEANDYNTTPTDTRYDVEGATAWWKASTTAVQLIDNNLYYLDKNSGKVICADDGNTIHTHTDISSAYRLSSAEGMLLCSTYYDVKTVDPKTGVSSVVYTPENGYIEGMKYEKGKLWVQINDGNGNSHRQSVDYVEPEVTDFTYTVENGKTTITGYTGTGGDITIPATLGGYPVTQIGENAFNNCTTLTSVTIPDSVTTIDSYAFHWCENLTSVTIPDSVTTIGDAAFNGCDSLASVTIGNSVTTIGNDAFRGCPSLTSLTIPDSVTVIGESAFSNCTGLTSVTIPSKVTTISNYLFYYCPNLTSVSLPVTVVAIGRDAFGECLKLTDIYYDGTVNQWQLISVDTGNNCLRNATVHFPEPEKTDYTYTVENGKATITKYNGLGGDVVIPAELGGYPVTTIGYEAFYGCTSLTSVIIPDSVTGIDEAAFYSCTSLISATFPNSVTKIGEWMFLSCNKLTTVNIPDSVTIIGEGAFYGCSNLASITIPDSVTKIGVDAFAGCIRLTSVTIPNSVTAIYEGTFYYCESLTTVTIPDSVTYVGEGAFDNCNITKIIVTEGSKTITDTMVVGKGTLEEVVIPNSVTIIGECAFYGCSYLNSVVIPDSVTKIGVDAFAGCIRLTSITIPSSVTAIYEGTFYYCESLASVTIPDSITYIGESAFANCTKLTDVYYDGTQEQWEKVSVGTGNESLQNATVYFAEPESTDYTYTVEDGKATITGYNGAGGDVIIPDTLGGYPVTAIGKNAFQTCEKLETVVIPDGVETLGTYAFWDCPNLRSVTIGKGVTSFGERAFGNCKILNRVIISEGVTSIGTAAFEFCTGLEVISIPEGVTEIGERAFRLTDLKKISLPETVKTIGLSAFESCNELAAVYYAGTQEQWNEISVGESNAYLLSATMEFGKTPETPLVPEYTYKVENGEATIIKYNGPGGEIAIPMVFGGYRVTGIGQEVFADCDNLTAVTINYGITNIGKKAFYDCDGLTSLWISDTVTTIGEAAFSGCDNLETITVPHSVQTMEGYVFASCTGLKMVGISNSITEIGEHLFDACTGLTSVMIPDGVTTIGDGAFYQCAGLTTVTIPGSVTTIGASAFAGCDALTNVFYKGTSEQWQEVTVGSGNEKLQNAEIRYTMDPADPGDADFTYRLENGEATITGYTGAGGDITIPSVLGGCPVTTIDYYAFERNNDLTSVVIPGTVKTIDFGAFRYCENLTSVTLGEGIVDMGTQTFMGCTSLTSIVIPDSVTEISAEVFYECTGLEEVTIGSGVKTIGNSAFIFCRNLKTVRIPASVQSIDRMAFYACDNLSAYYVHEDNAFFSGVLGVLYNKDKTVLIMAPTAWSGIGVMPETVTVISDRAFQYCCNLTEIEIGPNVKTIGESAFYGCTGLTSVTIPEGVTTIGESAFAECANLRSVTIPGSVTTIENYAFEYCSNLTFVTIGKGVTTIGENAFLGCNSLITVTIPEGMVDIGRGAFYNCGNLTSVTIPASVTYIGDYAFDCCYIQNVYYAGTQSKWNAIDIRERNNNLLFTTIHYQHVHDFSYTSGVTVAATCEEAGYTEYTCVFGEKYCADYTPALGHDYSGTVTVVAPTCTGEGYTATQCTRCTGGMCSDFTDPLGHSMVFMEAVPATCTEAGRTAGTACERCGLYGTVTEEPALDHSFTNYVSNNDATCIWNGTETAKCDRCEETSTRTEEGSAKGHEYEAVVSEPTCLYEGFTTYICRRCNHAYNDDWVDALGHSYTNACDTTCNRTDCGATRKITHSYAAATCTKPKTCKICKATSGKALGHTYKSGSCTRCKYKPAGAKITTQPVNVAVASGKTAKVTVKATGTGLKYTWYYAKKGAKTYTKATSTTNSYSLKMSSSYNGTKVYCVVSDAYGNSVKSTVVTLYKGTPAKITTQPKSTTVANGKTGSITLKASGSSLKYQWYIKYKGASSFTKVGKSSKTYSFKMVSELNGAQVYCVVKDKYGIEVKSTVVTIKQAPQPKITAQPKSTKAFSGKTVKFTVKATGEGLKYQWYYAKKGSTKFKKLSAKSATYSVKVSSSVDGRKYYCVVTDKYGQTVKTSTVTLTMQKAAKITTQPKNVSVKNGKTAKVTIKATGDGLKYTWYYLLSGQTKYQKASFTGNTFSVKMAAKYKNCKVYCTIADQYGNSVKSKTVTLKMK